ncbi:MAG TPA: hypothetical protein VMM55_10675 [Thermohalobaculum sp.]|nr:hypothetical protein [Thermohalobaculum sp.]
MTSRALLTGFEPFRDWPVNSSWEGVRLVARRRGDVLAARLPVEHGRAAVELRALIGESRPGIVLLVGLAAGTAFRLETLARPRPLAHAPAVRRGRWPFAASVRALAGHGIPVRLSRDAGSYVCDTTYWAALGEVAPRRCVFLHVPPLGPGWSAPRIARGIEAVLDAGLSARATE